MANIFGDNHNNKLFGTTFPDTIVGYGGHDQLFGLGGNDRLIGGLGDDFLDGGAGIDTADYSSGRLGFSGATAGVTVNLTLAGAQKTGGAGVDTLVSIENLTGTNFDDTLTGNSFANTLSAGGGSVKPNGVTGIDTLSGGGGNDTLNGGPDTNSLIGGSGNDTLNGGTGHGGMYGGSGDDFLDGRNGWYSTIEGGDGNDTLYVGVGHEWDFSSHSGDSGNDTIIGNTGRDELRGGTGNDVLVGGGDDDFLIGEVGRDHLTGGVGRDGFWYDQVIESVAGAGNRDVITDFNGAGSATGDRIILYLIDANELQSGKQNFNYIGSNAFTAAGQLRYANGILSGSTDADATAEFQIELLGAPVLHVGGVNGSDIILQ
jgi:Ca2+-binding RTX toxin-like protein